MRGLRVVILQPYLTRFAVLRVKYILHDVLRYERQDDVGCQ
jgi:hypothetical protein